jgi:hypothetical protein
MNADVGTKDASTMPATVVFGPRRPAATPSMHGRLWADGTSSFCDGISAQEDGITDSDPGLRQHVPAADAGDRDERQDPSGGRAASEQATGPPDETDNSATCWIPWVSSRSRSSASASANRVCRMPPAELEPCPHSPSCQTTKVTSACSWWPPLAVTSSGAGDVARSRPWAGRAPTAAAGAVRPLPALQGERDPEEAFGEAIERASALPPLERARIELLFGEWLRRERRCADARAHLRAALELFQRLGTARWAEHTEAELRATGETARKRDPFAAAELTPQELVSAGALPGGACGAGEDRAVNAAQRGRGRAGR